MTSDTDTSAETVGVLAALIAAADPDYEGMSAPTLLALAAERDALRDNYTYIGKDGKSVLARDLEDERDALKAELAGARNAALDEAAKVADDEAERMRSGEFADMYSKGYAANADDISFNITALKALSTSKETKA